MASRDASYDCRGAQRTLAEHRLTGGVCTNCGATAQHIELVRHHREMESIAERTMYAQVWATLVGAVFAGADPNLRNVVMSADADNETERANACSLILGAARAFANNIIQIGRG